MTDTAKPWTMERRSTMARKIEKEAGRAAARLGAKACVIVAFFPDGEHVHMQDGGITPMPLPELYKLLLTSHTITEESGGEDVALQ